MELLRLPCRVVFFLVVILLGLLAKLCPVVAQTSRDGTIGLGTSFSGNQTQRSPSGIFEIGLFSPSGSDLVYLGIWFADILPRSVVWVANRANPTTRVDATFSMSISGELVVLDAGRIVWSSGTEGLNVNIAVLQDTGNLVLEAENSTAVWESFDQSGDTWLPTMRMKPGRKLKSWLTPTQPAEGLYTLEVHPTGELTCVWNNYKQYWSSGRWNGHSFDDYLPEKAPVTWVDDTTARSAGFSWFVSESATGEQLNKARIVMSWDGELQHFLWDPQKQSWTRFWTEPREACGVYGFCGKNSVCKSSWSASKGKDYTSCSCLPGFVEPAEGSKKPSETAEAGEEPAAGCVQEMEANCSMGSGMSEEGSNNSEDGFVEVKEKSLDLRFSMSEVRRAEWECRTACARDCLCTGYYYEGSDGNCSLVTGEVYWEAGDRLGAGAFYVKVVDAMDSNQSLTDDNLKKQNKKKQLIRWLVIAIATTYVLLLLLMAFLFLSHRHSSTCCSPPRLLKHSFHSSLPPPPPS